jgi:bacterial/archaeal transporter family-2 protein
MIYIILAIIGGCLTILSMIVNSRLAGKIGVLQSTFINYVVGLLIALILAVITGSLNIVKINNFTNIPLWAFLGGFIGVMVVASSNIIIPKIPIIYSTVLIFIGQIFTGIIIDYVMKGSISKGKIIGGLLIIAGMIYNSNIDKNELKS